MAVLIKTADLTVEVVLVLERHKFEIPTMGAAFPCLVWDHEGRASEAERTAIACALLEAGCCYAVCAGLDCGKWHDAIDLEWVRRDLSEPKGKLASGFTMTTEHGDEGPDEVAEFLVRSTSFDEHHFRHFLILHVGSGANLDAVNEAVCRVAVEASEI
jgi:hypothetical protein